MSSLHTSASFIETRGLSRHYRVGPAEIHALRDVNLKVERGQYIAVIGVSGSGKSTLLHILGGLDTPDEGAVWVQQQELTALDRHQRTLYRRSSVGFIFQSYYLVASLTASENVALALTFQGVYGSERARRASEALDRVGLGAAGRPSANGAQRR